MFIIEMNERNTFHLVGVYKLRLQDLAFFDHLPPSVYIFYGIKVYKKSIFLTTYPPFCCKRSWWTPTKQPGTSWPTWNFKEAGKNCNGFYLH